MDNNCMDRDKHPIHVCQLKKTGQLEDIARRSASPAFVCHNCNAVADRAEDLCNPGAMPPR